MIHSRTGSEIVGTFKDLIRWLIPRPWALSLVGGATVLSLLAYPPWIAYLPDVFRIPSDDIELGHSFFAERPKVAGDCIQSRYIPPSGGRYRLPGRTECLQRGILLNGVNVRYWRVRINGGRLAIELLLASVATALSHLALSRARLSPMFQTSNDPPAYDSRT